MLFSRPILIVCTYLLCLATAVQDDYFYENYDESEVSPQTTFRPAPPPIDFPSDPNIIPLTRGRGYVRGKVLRTAWTGRNFKAFLGLKYGLVSGGFGRFQPAQESFFLSGVIEATNEPRACPSFPELQKVQRAEQQGVNIDDCLTLSVFTPNVLGSLPVMVYVHGEMLFDGSAEEAKPEYLLEKDIVLVAVNYRLAPFGFLSTLTDQIPGNAALSDIELATKWVVDNIAAFGGDPNSITLFGQAGGATLIHALSISEKVKDKFFDRLILQSGTALNPIFIDEEPLLAARGIAREARCPYSTLNSQQNLTECLGLLTTSQLLTAFVNHCNRNENYGINTYGGFKLVVGDKLGYIPVHPALMVKSSNFSILGGVTKDAGAFFLTRKYDELVRIKSRNITDYINVVLKYTTAPKNYATWRRWALEHIFSPADIQMPVLSNLASGLLELTNLILYKAPLLESIKTSWRVNATYLYSFDYRGHFHRYPRRRSHFPYEIDANLSDDNIYLFPYPDEVSHLGNLDRNVAQSMVTMWTNFATLGAPDEKLWPQVNNDYGPFVRITRALELDYHFGEGIPLPNLFVAPITVLNSTSNFNTRRFS